MTMPSSFRISTKSNQAGKAAKRPGSEMFHVEQGTRKDESLHAPMLSSMDGNTAADLGAVREAVREGITVAEAAGLYAGVGARMVLRRQGLI